MTEASGFYLLRFMRLKTDSCSWVLSREEDNHVEWPGEDWTMIGSQSVPDSHLEQTRKRVNEDFE